MPARIRRISFWVNQEQLSRTPLSTGGFTKPEVRELAHQYGLALANKPDSQEICLYSRRRLQAIIDAYLEPFALVALAVAFSAVSLYYYLQVLKRAYVMPAIDETPIKAHPVTMAVLLLIAAALWCWMLPSAAPELDTELLSDPHSALLFRRMALSLRTGLRAARSNRAQNKRSGAEFLLLRASELARSAWEG